MQDPDIRAKVLWEGMCVIKPWEAIPEAVLAMEPHIYEDISIYNGVLDEEQKEVLQVSRLCTHICGLSHVHGNISSTWKLWQAWDTLARGCR